MKRHLNGWSVIEREMGRQSRRQCDIARLLGVSPAAVSQIKQGKYLLSPRQMEGIMLYLNFDERRRDEFLTEIFNARITPSDERPRYRVRSTPDGSTGAHDCENSVPLGGAELLESYCPGLEPIQEFLSRNSAERFIIAPEIDGCCAVRLSAETSRCHLPPFSIIVIGDRRPEPGALLFARLRSYGLVLCEFMPEGELIRLRDPDRSCDDIVLRRCEFAAESVFLAPVSELVVRLRRGRG